MNILMFGWEFPPFTSGGLGTACKGLTSGLANLGARVTFVMPRGESQTHGSVKVVIPGKESIHMDNKEIQSLLRPYMTPETYTEQLRTVIKEKSSTMPSLYGTNLFLEVERFGSKGGRVAKQLKHDVIHAHDWMTFKAGIEAKKASGKPLVVHVHATEYDRTGGNPNEYVLKAEHEGMHAADLIVAVSQYTKNMITSNYGIHPDKVHVVHNAVEQVCDLPESSHSVKHFKTVLFLGRLTLQKGPDYFLQAAHRVLSYFPQVRFIVAGSGDMESQLIKQAASLGIARNVLFSGFVSGAKLSRMYSMADLYVMPSVSEPFGIAPLEALKHGTPVIISKQSGVSEVLNHCLTCDFWDTEKLAAQIISVLQYPALQESLKENGSYEVSSMNWTTAAKKCMDVYSSAVTLAESGSPRGSL